MSDLTEPNWDLLPHEPERFFGLPDGFDRKELKRSYNALIRRFKPESHPAEFQRIRAAYERLERELRYGDAVTFDWSHSARPGEDETTRHHETMPAARSADLESASEFQMAETQPPKKTALERIQARLQIEPLDKIVRELTAEPRKTPFDFFMLAILSDTCEAEGTISFWEWLVRGLVQHPNDPGLTRLLTEFLRSNPPREQLPQMARAVAQAIPNDLFFRLSEPLWDELMETMPFELLAKLLADCEDSLRVHELHDRLTFYVHFLRRAMFVADDEWFSAKFMMLEDNAVDLDNSLNDDVELLILLKKYRAERSQFLNGSAGRAAIDQTICDYCTKDDFEADLAVVNCQSQMATDTTWLHQAFPTTDCDFPAWWKLWKHITTEVAERCGFSESNADPKQQRHQLQQVLQHCEEALRGSWHGYALAWEYFWIARWGFLAARILPLVVFAILPVVLWTVFINLVSPSSHTQQILWDAVIVSTVVAVPILFIKVFTDTKSKQAIEQQCQRVGTRLVQKCYQRYWRALLEQHLRLTQQPYEQFVEQLSQAQAETKSGVIDRVCSRATNDYALACLTCAQQFLR